MSNFSANRSPGGENWVPSIFHGVGRGWSPFSSVERGGGDVGAKDKGPTSGLSAIAEKGTLSSLADVDFLEIKRQSMPGIKSERPGQLCTKTPEKFENIKATLGKNI